MLIGAGESPDENGMYSVKNCSNRSVNSGSLFFLICCLREHASSIILKQPHVLREHVAVKF